MAIMTKGFLKVGNVATRRRMTYEEYIESYKQYKAEKAKLIASFK